VIYIISLKKMGGGLTVSDKKHAGKPVEIKDKNGYNRVPALLLLLLLLSLLLLLLLLLL
jgi:hypothetical protein